MARRHAVMNPSQPPAPPPRVSRPTPAPPAGSRVTRFGSAVGAAMIASVLCSVPAARRIAQAADAGSAWPALVAVTLLPMLVAVLTLRQARTGLRAFSGNGDEKHSFALTLWTAGFLFTSVALGAVLRDKTHHHALAGATFALGSAAAGIALVPVCRRLATLQANWSEGGRTMRLVLLGGALLLAAFGGVFVLSRIVPTTGPFSRTAAANVIDVLAFAMAALLASRPEFAERRVLALLGPPVAATIFAFGLRSLLATPTLGAAIEESAPTFSALARLIAPVDPPSTSGGADAIDAPASGEVPSP